MKHRIGSWVILAILTLCAAGLAKDVVVDSLWTSAPVRIDGQDLDWQNVPLNLDKNSKAEYALRNDGRNLYVYFLFKTWESFTTIEATGIKVFYTVDGKKKKDLGVHFLRRQVTGEELIASMEAKGELLTEDRKAEMKKGKAFLLFDYQVINAKKLEAPADPSVPADPPHFRSAPKQKALVYELSIPLSRTNEPGGIGAQAGQTIMLGFEWGGMTKEIMKDVMAGRASSGAMASARAGGSDSGFRDSSGDGEMYDDGPANFNRDPRFKKHAFWVGVKLASQGS